MNIETYTRRESMLRLHKTLLESEESMQNGAQEFTVDKVAAAMREAVRDVVNIQHDEQ